MIRTDGTVIDSPAKAGGFLRACGEKNCYTALNNPTFTLCFTVGCSLEPLSGFYAFYATLIVLLVYCLGLAQDQWVGLRLSIL